MQMSFFWQAAKSTDAFPSFAYVALGLVNYVHVVMSARSVGYRLWASVCVSKCPGQPANWLNIEQMPTGCVLGSSGPPARTPLLNVVCLAPAFRALFA